MIVVGDTSPLNYLVQIGCAELLSQLYKRLLVPNAVAVELMDLRTPRAVRQWIETPLDWLEIVVVDTSGDQALPALGPGETEAILLAEARKAELILMDERAGVRIARSRGLQVQGTLGVLIEAARTGFVDIDIAIARLSSTSFRSTSGLFEAARRSVVTPAP